jgi:putative hydroxymethylpyrimidine transport system substrate-binding protein
VTAVAALVQEPLTSLISLPRAGIEAPEDLAGKTVGTAGIDYQSAFLTAILDRAGVDRGEVEERNLGFNLVPGIVSGRADAVLGAFWNYEGTDLRLQGRDPRVIRIEQAGVPPYDELVLVANEERLERDPAPLRAFIAALARGNERLQADPEAGLDALLAANPDLDRELQAEVVDVTLELFEPPAGKPYGWLDPRAWRRFADFMVDAGLIEPGAAEGAYTNELLPRRRRSGGPDA